MDLEFLEKQVKKTLTNMDANRLTISEKLLFRSKPSSKSKKELKDTIMKASPLKLMMYNDKYVDKSGLNKLKSIQEYQGFKYEKINEFMRTGKISFSLNVSDRLYLKKSNITSDSNLMKYTNKTKQDIDKSFIMNIEKNKRSMDELTNTITNIKSTIMNAPRFKRNVYVYRGEKNYDTIFALNEKDSSLRNNQKHKLRQINMKEGSTYNSKGFNSFSMAPWIASRFSGKNPCCIYRLRIDPQTPVLVLPWKTSGVFEGEFEVLLPPAKFKVTKVRSINSDESPQISIKVYDIEFVKVLAST